MKSTLTALAALLASTTLASAGGIERTLNNYGILFEQGDYVEFGISNVNPNVSGDYPGPLGGGSTGNMANSETLPSLSYKNQLTDNIAVGLFLNRPYGASAEYTMGAYTGLAADWKSAGTTLVLKYDVNENISVYGGARYVSSSADIAIPALLATGGATTSPAFNYTATGEQDGQTSFVGGVAYQRPDIALRVALTYEQGFTHTFATTENSIGFMLSDFESTTEVEMPQAITLDFQTGVAANTLVFGSIRHVEWSVWEVRPAGFEGATGDRVTGFDNDTTTFTLGVGRRLNEELSVFARIGYEEAKGGEASRLSPTDGSRSIGIGGSYRMDDMKVTGGIQYTMLGDATDGSTTEFTDNTAVSVGLNIGYYF